MIKYIYYILVCFTMCCISCTTKQSKIEVYLLKNRAPILDGIPYSEANDITDSVELRKYELVKYDTVSNYPISSGRFNVGIVDLQPEPFIKNEEILFFNLKNNKFKFAPSVAGRIADLPDNMHQGTQFAITVNGKPKLTGYFMNFSVWCDWYYIRFWKKDQETELMNETSFELFNGYMRGKHEDLTPPYPPELIEAFRSSGRLIE